MPKFNKITTAFNAGELSPELAVRGDIDQFNRGCKKALNIELLPEGGFTRRGGFKSLDTVVVGDISTGVALHSFEIRKDLVYQILFLEGTTIDDIDIYIYKEGSLVDTAKYIDNSVEGITIDDVKEIRVCQNVNNFIMTHPDVPVKNLRLDNEISNQFIVETVEFINEPEFAFFDDLSPEQTFDVQDLRIRLDNHTGTGDGITKDVTDPFRDFKVGFNNVETQDITYCSPYNVGTLNTSDEKRNWVLRDQTGRSELFVEVNTSDGNFEFDFRMSHALSGFNINLGKFKRSDYVTDQEFIDAITNEMHKQFVDTFDNGGLSNDATQYTTPIFRGLIQSGTFATGDLIFRIFCENAELNTDLYLTVSDWNLFTDNMTITLNGYLFDEGYANTIIQVYNEFSKFGFWKDFSNNVKFTFPLVSNLQAEVDEVNLLNGVYAPALIVRFEINGIDSLNYPKVSGVFTEPKKWDFEVTSISGSKQVNGFSGLENAWSEVRGYPVSCAFIENRLCFGGSKSLPNFLWCSVTGDFFNFTNTDGLANEAILNVSPTSTTLNNIKHLSGVRSLQVFTEGSEHYNPQALTPNTISLPLQSNEGIYDTLKPVIIDNSTYFLSGNGDTLRRFLYNETEQSYRAENVSILSKHLVDKPIDIAAVKTDNSNFIYLLNSDGTLTVYQTVREQNISGYFKWESYGTKILSITESEDKLYMIGWIPFSTSGTLYKMFVYDKTSTLDLQTNNLNLEEINLFEGNYGYSNIITNGIVGDDATESVERNKVEYSELLTTTLNPYTGEQVKVGVDFLPTVETTDITANFGTGEKMSGRKRINETWLHLDNAIGYNLTYKGKQYIIPYRVSPQNDNDPDRFTGDKRVRRMLGYIDRDNITITQDYPFNYGTVLGITISIRVE